MSYIDKILCLLGRYNVDDKDLLKLLEEVDKKLVLSDKIEKCLYDSELYLVYKHTDPNGKVYIGITQNHPQTRWNEGGGYESQNKFYRAIQKYGWINFDHEILDASLTKDEALELENKYILEFKSYDEKYGYNTRVNIKPPKYEVKKETKSEAKKEVKSEAKKARGEVKGEAKRGNNKSYKISDIASKLIDAYGLVTVNDRIFSSANDEISDAEIEKMLAKEILKEYNIPVKKQKDILDAIKLLSGVKVEKLPSELQYLLGGEESLVFEWISATNITVEQLAMQPCGSLYVMCSEWCENHGGKCGKKTFYKIIEEKYKVKRKQKGDGKRYFVVRGS